MSINEVEKVDLDLRRLEQQTYSFDVELEDNRDEFKGMLQDAFSFADRNIEDGDLIFEDLEEIFREYLDKRSLKIEK